jgi:hypothetical protein
MLAALKELLSVNEKSAGISPDMIGNRVAFKSFLAECEGRVNAATNLARSAIQRAEAAKKEQP